MVRIYFAEPIKSCIFEAFWVEKSYSFTFKLGRCCKKDTGQTDMTFHFREAFMVVGIVASSISSASFPSLRSLLRPQEVIPIDSLLSMSLPRSQRQSTLQGQVSIRWDHQWFENRSFDYQLGPARARVFLWTYHDLPMFLPGQQSDSRCGRIKFHFIVVSDN